MIGPKTPKMTAAEEKRQYELAAQRDKGRCVRCLAFGVQMDHRQNRMRGNTVLANLQGLCPACHLWKTEHPADAIKAGFAVSRYQDPWAWPAWREDVRSWVLYNDKPVDGKWFRKITASTASMLTHGAVG